MSLSTEDAVREVYRFALQENLKKDLETTEEFARYRSIAETAAERIDAERASFHTNYQQRLREAREVILREQSGQFLDRPKPTWAKDKPLPAERIELLAINRVQADHEARIAAIRVDETNDYRMLQNQCRERIGRAIHVRETRGEELTERFNLTNQISPEMAKSRGRSGPSQS